MAKKPIGGRIRNQVHGWGAQCVQGFPLALGTVCGTQEGSGLGTDFEDKLTVVIQGLVCSLEFILQPLAALDF